MIRQVASIASLLNAGANIEYETRKGNWTALTKAAGHGQLESIKCLIERGATVDHETSDSKTVSESCCLDDEAVAQALICAAAKGKLKAVSVLVELGAAVNYLTRTGRTGNYLVMAPKSQDSIASDEWLL